MHSVNPHLLQTTRYRADGTARDPHAHHASEHRAALRAMRRARREAEIARVRGLLLRLGQARSRARSGQPQV